MKAIVLMLLLVACGGKKDADPGAGSATATGSGSATAGSNAGSGSDSGSAAPELTAAAPEAALPTEVDFEDDASARITEKNVDAELEAIENQLTQ